MWRAALVPLVLVPLACTKQDGSKHQVRPPVASDAGPPRADAARPATPSVSPAERAKQTLERLVTALRTDEAAVLATFAPDAVVLVPNPREVSEPNSGLREALARLPPSATLADVTVDKLVAGGNAEAIWLTAELTLVHGDDVKTVRVTELATADRGWKVVVGAFSEPNTVTGRKHGPGPLAFGTPAGPLTAMLVDPSKLGVALAADPTVTVIGPKEGQRAQGAGAKNFLAEWSGLELETNAREVRGSGWGYALARLKLNVPGEKHPARLSALVLGVPGGDRWSVVAAHYAAP